MAGRWRFRRSSCGRVATLRPAGLPHPLELGAEVIHGKPPELWRMAQTAGLLVYEALGDHWRSDRGRLTQNG